MFYRDTGHGHYYWWGYRHEAAITADFLYRTLKLPAFDASQLDEQSIKAIGEDFAIIADSYRLDDEIVPDEQKAFDYYKKAATLNHPKANFMMGDYYQEGELVDKDMDKAISYYQKSAELEYPFAYTR
jgi:TPR repeat protein